ncbi:MAG: CoA pyrophosphatase [Desulfotomaculaceae bacterium]|nr:CoA pyrophosphatase [Desulfotomaculaceae bacterium]
MEEFRRILGNRLPEFQNMVECLVSAVLLPIAKVNGEPHVLFEVRAEHLKRQPGEICFPGGMVEQSELDNPKEAAIREATEELGIVREQIELIGPLDYCISASGILIYPYVGLIARPDQIVPNSGEVGEVFLVPVKYFLTNRPCQSSIEVATRFAEGFPFHWIPQSYKKGWRSLGSTPVYFYKYEDRIIWGVTAIILHNFINIYGKLKYNQ